MNNLDNNFSDKNIIKSVLKVFNLLEVLTKHEKLSITKLSELTGYSKSTTQRIVNTLKHLKYIYQDVDTNEYFATIKLYELGSNVINNIAIRNVAKPHILKLHNELNETVNLAVLDENNVVYLDKLVSKSPLRAELEIGIKVPIYCSALGKAIAAFNNKKVSFQDSYIKYTENTISSDKDLDMDLQKVKEQGYAIDNEEYVKGLICISVPILNPNNMSIASISISIPSTRFEKNSVKYYTSTLKNYATKIQNDMY